jgi:hypothetical protein
MIEIYYTIILPFLIDSKTSIIKFKGLIFYINKKKVKVFLLKERPLPFLNILSALQKATYI